MNTDHTKWTELLEMAVKQPGVLMKAYSAFHGYSLGNQILAMVQCQMRGIEPGPINTYPGWQALGRQVRKNEKALTLCMPLARKGKDNAGNEQVFITAFVYKPRWFVLSQTDGEPIPMQTTPKWDAARALAALNIQQVPFTDTNGNVQGYASRREISISPV